MAHFFIIGSLPADIFSESWLDEESGFGDVPEWKLHEQHVMKL